MRWPRPQRGGKSQKGNPRNTHHHFLHTRLAANVLSHQPGLLMLEDVTMIHEGVLARCQLIESDEKLRPVLDKHYVFPAREMSGRRCSRDGQDAEQCAVDVKRVCHSSRDYLPDLAGSDLGLYVDAFHIERLS